MVKLIDAWRKDTGEKLADRVPETWIRDGVNPNLSATPLDVPGQDQPAQPAPAPTPFPTQQEA